MLFRYNNGGVPIVADGLDATWGWGWGQELYFQGHEQDFREGRVLTDKFARRHKRVLLIRFGGWWCAVVKSAVVKSKLEPLAADFATSNMATKRMQQPKDRRYLQCHRFYTSKNMGIHTQNCTKWDIPGGGTSSQLISQLGEQSDDDSIMEEMLRLSESPLNSHTNPGNHQSPGAFDDFGLDDDAVLLQGIVEEGMDQYKRTYDSKEDEDWWNEFCVPEIEPLQEIDKDKAEEFEDLLNWIDNEFDLEVDQNCEKSALIIP